jgi:hypothetical protein
MFPAFVSGLFGQPYTRVFLTRISVVVKKFCEDPDIFRRPARLRRFDLAV